MDIFGIGTRILNSIHEHARLARGTGRSYVLSDMVQPGDGIVFASRQDGIDFANLQLKRGRTTFYHAYIVSPAVGVNTHDRRTWKSHGCKRVFFDHEWLEQYYASRMSSMMSDLQSLALLSDGDAL